MYTLVRTLMTLRHLSQAEVTRNTGISRAALSKFLTGLSELRSDGLCILLKNIGVDIDEIIRAEIDKAMGKGEGEQKKETVGEDFLSLLEKRDPLTAKTVSDILLSSFKNTKNAEVKSQLMRIAKFRDSIKLVRRIPC